MKSVLLVLALLVAGAVAFHYLSSDDPEWLLGRWEYQAVSADEGNDYLVFSPGGQVDFENDLGKYYSCDYWTRAEQLTIECKVRGEVREVVYDIAPDRLSFENRAESSVYRKTDD